MNDRRTPTVLALALTAGVCGTTLVGCADPEQSDVELRVARQPLTADTPVFLNPGLAGWPFDPAIKARLEADGHVVHTLTVSPFGPVRLRAVQLRDQIDEILASSGAEKGVMVAHSMGGVDARYLVCDAGLGYDKIAAIASIASPHRGTAIADFVVNNTPSLLQYGVNKLLEKLGQTPSAAEDLEALYDLSRPQMAAFNIDCADRADVEYYSYASAVAKPSAGLNPWLVPSYYIIKDKEGSNDGIASEASAKWGHFLGTLKADHADHVGGALGVKSDVDHPGFYSTALREMIQNYNAGTYRPSYSAVPQSRHPYASNLSETKEVYVPGALELSVTFDDRTNVEQGYDSISIFDALGDPHPNNPFTGSELAGATLTVAGDTMKIVLESDFSVQAWGYALTSVEPVRYPESVHDYSNNAATRESFSRAGAQSLSVTFSDETIVEDTFDYIFVLDSTGKAVAGSPFTGEELAGATVEVPGDTVTIELVSDYSETEWGYAVTGIVAQ